MFHDDEVGVAMELVDIGIAAENAGISPSGDDYRFVVAADGQDRPLGYACFGRVPMTDASFDLYWIVVERALQGRGVGRVLLAEVEAEVTRLQGRMVLVETASKPQYAATRAFYLRLAYQEIARVPDFYRLGDDRIIYWKRLDGHLPAERTP